MPLCEVPGQAELAVVMEATQCLPVWGERVVAGREKAVGLWGAVWVRALPGCVHVLKFNETFMIHVLF